MRVSALLKSSFLAAGLLTVVAVAPVFAQAKQIIPSGTPNPFSAAVKAGDFIYVSGTIGSAAGVSGDIKKQTKDTLDSIAATLKSAGSVITNAASVTVYLKNAADFAAMNEVYTTYFPKDPPARTTLVPTQPLANPDGLVEISMVAIPNGGERTVIRPDGWINAPLPYSYGIKSGNTLFLAGLVSRNGKDNSNVPGDLGAQTKVAMDNAAAILKQAGMGFGDIVSSRVWTTPDSNTPMNDAYRPYFEGVIPPARAAVRVGALTSPDYQVEVTFTAVKDPTRKAIVVPNADGTPARPNANLSPAIQVGNRLYIAGMLGSVAANKGDAKAQTIEALARIERTLKFAGFDWSNVVDALVYFPDMTKYQDMNAGYRETFTKDFPARATIGAGLGGDALVEIMLTAVK